MRRLLLALAIVACSSILSAASDGQTVQPSTRITCYTTHDADFFYLAAVVEKPALQATVTAHFADPSTDDSVSLFLQVVEGPVGAVRSARSIQMSVSAAGGAQLYRGASATPLAGPQDFLQRDGVLQPFKCGVTRQPAGEGTPARFTVEMAVPWLELGGPPVPSQRMRFNVVLRSAAPGSPSLVSLSPGVKEPRDIQNPSLWTDIVFADAAVRSVPGAPDARVCARVFTAKPVMDGTVADAEWNRVTGFVFEATETGVVTGSAAVPLAVARSRPPVEHRAPLPAVPARPMTAATVSPIELASVAKTVFALYRMDYQMDPRKLWEVRSLWPADQPRGLRRAPEEGSGPWITFDRIDWHWRHLERSRQAGIDVVVPVIDADEVRSGGPAARALGALAQARRLMEAAGVAAPQVAPCLEGGASVRDANAETDALYQAVRAVFLRVDPSARARVPVRSGDRNEYAVLLWVRNAGLLAHLEPGGLDDLRGRFRSEFGDDIVLVAPEGSGFNVPALARWTPVAGRGVSVNGSGRLRVASVSPCVALDAESPRWPGAPPARRDGSAYREAWRQAMAGNAQWVIVDSWNDYVSGSEIAPTDQDGLRYSDMTRVFSRAFCSPPAVAAHATADSVPTIVRTGSAVRASVTLRNAGNATWEPGSHVLAVSWRPVGGGAASQTVVPLPSAAPPGAALTAPLPLRAPVTPGRYDLAVDVVAADRSGKPVTVSGGPHALLRSIDVANQDASDPASVATCVASDLPSALERGCVYRTRIVLRNDGATVWPRGSRVAARVAWLQPAGETDAQTSGLSAELPADVAPGEETSVAVPVALCGPAGEPLSPPTGSSGSLLVRWEVHAGEKPESGAVTRAIAIDLVEADIGARFTVERIPSSMPAERRIPVPIGIRNAGPLVWRKDTTRVGYHWYYQDGTLAVWEDETTPIARDLAPGEELPDLPAFVVAPPYDGYYWLVWDVKIGDTWASTLPSVRARETIVRLVRVVRGRLAFPDLRSAYNLDVISTEGRPGDGDFDGQGRSLPAEILPPTVSADVTASGLYSDPSTGLDSERRIAFRWGPKADGERNAIRCTGQQVVVASDAKTAVRVRAVHLLAASLKAETPASFTLGFVDGSEQYSSMPISAWSGEPAFREPIAAAVPYTRMRNGALGGAVHLYRYTIRVAEPKPLRSITMPDSADVRVLAITLER